MRFEEHRMGWGLNFDLLKSWDLGCRISGWGFGYKVGDQSLRLRLEV